LEFLYPHCSVEQVAAPTRLLLMFVHQPRSNKYLRPLSSRSNVLDEARHALRDPPQRLQRVVQRRGRQNPDHLHGDVLPEARARRTELAAVRGALAAARDDCADSGSGGAALISVAAMRRRSETELKGCRRQRPPDLAAICDAIAVSDTSARRMPWRRVRVGGSVAPLYR
jgi:hypothetical protein